VTTEIVPYNGNFLKVTLRQPLTWDDEINSIRFQNAILTLIGFYQHQEYSLNIW
jgi:hypothetical protein